MPGDWGKETVVLVQIDVPFCSREYGDAFFSPTGGCSAVLGASGTRKCYNTRFTCQDENNYNPGTLTLTLGRKTQPRLWVKHGYVLPMLQSVATTPGSINLGAMDRSAAALGQREVVNIVCKDGRHSDLLVDKYRLERQSGAAASGSPSETFDPYTRGTFWGKFLARNPYHHGYPLRVYEGFRGDALADMRVRHYVIDRIEGPAGGEVKIVAKDLFALIEAKKAVAPEASTGELAANITAAATSATLSPTGIGNTEYPAAGYLRIGDEVMAFTRSSDTLTLTRAQFGTTAAAHEQQDLVQLCLRYSQMLAHDIVHDLFASYTALGSTGSPTGSPYINKSQWDSRASTISNLYSATITEPTPVFDLVGELCEQAGFTVIPDVSTGTIDLIALRSGTVDPTVDDADWIVRDSISVKRQDAKRTSQVWVYYGQINPTKDLDEPNNYHSRFVDPDLDAEEETQYGTAAIREVFSRWIPQFGRSAASGCSERLLAMFRDPPLEAQFRIHASRDGELELARYFYLETANVQDESGAVDQVAMATVQLKRGENEIGVKAQAVTFPQTQSATSPSVDVRQIFIENNTTDVNVRTLHDALYAAPTGPEVVQVFVVSGIVVGSTSSSTPAMRTGSWPDGVTLSIEIDGRIQGKGAAGGAGGDNDGNGANGATGGDALLVEYATTLDNSNGQIWAGGGGGGGGGGAHTFEFGVHLYGGGSGGGGGAGTNAGSGGAGGSGHSTGPAGSDGTATAGGAGGDAGPGTTLGGDGGAGGGPGEAGSAGGTGTGATSNGSAGSGGAAGNYINGISLVTWAGSPNGDLRGNVV